MLLNFLHCKCISSIYYGKNLNSIFSTKPKLCSPIISIWNGVHLGIFLFSLLLSFQKKKEKDFTWF